MKLKTAFIVSGITLSLGNIGYAQTDLSELNWLAGYWTATTDGNITEEFWTHVSGNMMLGLNRSVSSSGRASFEFLRIVQEEDVIRTAAFEERDVRSQTDAAHAHDFMGDVDQRVVGDGVEEDVGVSQREVEVDQGHRVPRPLGEDAPHIDAEAGASNAARGAALRRRVHRFACRSRNQPAV